MEYTRLGKSGLKVSRICLGMMTYGSQDWRPWIMDQKTCDEHVALALELGINFFDTANMYSLGVSEQYTGAAIKKLTQRDKVVIATKVFAPMSDDPNDHGLSRKHIMDQVDASLKRLGTDYIDLYQIHRWDYTTSIEETLEALHDMVKAGKVRYIGASSMFGWQFCQSLYLADLHNWTRFISMQNHYNLVYREEEREMIPLCQDQGIGLLPWSPLARGLITGSRTKDTTTSSRSETDDLALKFYQHPSDFDIAEVVAGVAERKGVTRAQVGLAWLLQKPTVAAPIIGATKAKYIEDAAGALGVKLSEEEVQELEAPYQLHPVIGHG